MKVEKNGNVKRREHFTHLEAIVPLLSRISPWLESKESSERERKIKEKLKNLTLKNIHNVVNPSSLVYDFFRRIW